MSWVQWRGETWPSTNAEAWLALHLWPADAGCPRQCWSWGLDHRLAPVQNPDGSEVERFLDLEVTNLHFSDRDWRRLSGLEICADAAWHERHETTNEYGQLELAQVRLSTYEIHRAHG